VPLNPASWRVLQRCLAHRDSQRTANPHAIVTKVTKAGRSPTSIAYVTHLLDACGAPPRSVRCTRLADLVNTIDPKLAAAFGMKPESVMYYLADHLDPGRELEMRPSNISPRNLIRIAIVETMGPGCGLAPTSVSRWSNHRGVP
jgi:hypothetical protein